MTTNSAEAIGSNIDLLTEILLKLQVKPLMRLKCVSKQWLSLISDSQFCLSHNHHHHTPYPAPTALLFDDRYNPAPECQIVPLKQDTVVPKVVFFDFLNAPNSVRIKHSCNGLFLCSSHSYIPANDFLGEEMFKMEEIYYICNPTTKQFKSLCFPSFEFQESLVSVCIAFDPLKSNHYNFICINRVNNKDIYQMNMYSSETDSWSPLKITFTAPFGLYFLIPVFCNGAVHWCSEDETSIYFDVDKECLNTMPMPNVAECVLHYFGESQGRLHLIVTEESYHLQLDVFEMVPDYSEWFVRYHVNLDAVRIAFPESYHTFSVLHVIRAQKEEDSIVVIYVDNKVISYNIHDGTSKKPCDVERPLPLESYTCLNTYQYFEILNSV